MGASEGEESGTSVGESKASRDNGTIVGASEEGGAPGDELPVPEGVRTAAPPSAAPD